jgi:hypothetical protein
VIERGFFFLEAFAITTWVRKRANQFIVFFKNSLPCIDPRAKDFSNVVTLFNVLTSGQFSAAFANIEIAAGAAHDVDALSCPEFGLNSK